MSEQDRKTIGGESAEIAPVRFKTLEPNWVDCNATNEMEEVRRAFWCVAGVVMASQNLEEAVLMRVRISKELQNWAYGGEPLPTPKKPIRQVFLKEVARLTEGIKEGVLLVLKMPKGQWKKFGGSESQQIGEEPLMLAYRRLNTIDKFDLISGELEKAIKDLRKQKADLSDSLAPKE